MDTTAILAMLKANLEIINTINDTYLAQLVQVAILEIEREGITLNVTNGNYAFDDANLIVMYAAYLYRHRAVTASDKYVTTASLMPGGMPRMLRYALNNRLLSEKMQ